MLRILIAAAVLIGAAYFYLNQGKDERVLETQQQALEKAKAVEKTVQEQAAKLATEIDRQTEEDSDDASDDDGQP